MLEFLEELNSVDMSQEKQSKRKQTVLSIHRVYLTALQESYMFKRKDLLDEGIDSFSQYVNQALMPRLTYEELSARLEVLATNEEIIVRDNYKVKDYTITAFNGILQCMEDRALDCIHVTFARMDPKTKKRIEEKGL